MTYSLLSLTNEIRQNYFFFSRLAEKSNIGKRVVELVSPHFGRYRVSIFQKIDLLANTHLQSQGSTLSIALRQLLQDFDTETNLSQELQQKAAEISKMITKLVSFATLPTEFETKDDILTFTPEQYKLFPMALSPSTRELFEQTPRFFVAMQKLLQKVFQGEYGNDLYQGFVDATFLTPQQLILFFLLDQMIDSLDIRQIEPFEKMSVEESEKLQKSGVTRQDVRAYFSQTNHQSELIEHALLMKTVSFFLSDSDALCKAAIDLVRIHVSPTLDELFRLLCLGVLPEGIEKEKAAILAKLQIVLHATTKKQFFRALEFSEATINQSDETDYPDDYPELLFALCCEMAKRNHPFLTDATCRLLSISYAEDVARIVRAICGELIKKGRDSVVSFSDSLGGAQTRRSGVHIKRVRREIAYFLVKTDPQVALTLYFQNHPDETTELLYDGLKYLAQEELDGRGFVKQLETSVELCDADLAAIVKLREFLHRSSFLFREMLTHHGYIQACQILQAIYPKDTMRKLLAFEEFLRLYREKSLDAATLFFKKACPSLEDLDFYLLCFRCRVLNSSDALALLPVILTDASDAVREQCQVFFFIDFGVGMLLDGTFEQDFSRHLERIEDPERLLSVLGVWVKSTDEFSSDEIESIREILGWKKLKNYQNESNVILLELLLKAHLDDKQTLLWNYFDLFSDDECKAVFLLNRFTYRSDVEVDSKHAGSMLKALKAVAFPVNIDEDVEGTGELLEQLTEIGAGVQQMLRRHGIEEVFRNCAPEEHSLLAIEEFVSLSTSNNTASRVDAILFLRKFLPNLSKKECFILALRCGILSPEQQMIVRECFNATGNGDVFENAVMIARVGA
jgi:hypothetical protein